MFFFHIIWFVFVFYFPLNADPKRRHWWPVVDWMIHSHVFPKPTLWLFTMCANVTRSCCSLYIASLCCPARLMFLWWTNHAAGLALPFLVLHVKDIFVQVLRITMTFRIHIHNVTNGDKFLVFVGNLKKKAGWHLCVHVLCLITIAAAAASRIIVKSLHIWEQRLALNLLAVFHKTVAVYFSKRRNGFEVVVISWRQRKHLLFLTHVNT